MRYILPMLLLVAALPLCAQEDVLYPYPSTFPLNIGVEPGAGFSIFSQGVGHSPIDNPTSPNRALKSGSGVGGFAALQAELPLGSTFALQGRVGYELKRFTSSGEGVADCPNNAENAFDTVDLSVRRTSSASYITSGLFLRADVGGNFFLVAGPVVHWWMGSLKISDRMEILSSGSCLFSSSGQKVAEAESTTEEGLNKTRFGLEGGVGYRIPLSGKVWLAPAVRFQFLFTPVGPDGVGQVDTFRHTTLGDLNLSFTDRMLHAVQLGVSLWWHP
jgi:hypothetical protein